MNKLIHAAAWLFLAVIQITCINAFAQNSIVTYQGRVLSSATNFTGSGQFKFAIVTSTNNSHTATATATISGGFVTILNPISGGNGYVSAPAVTISGGGGSGATATANLAGGAVTGYTVNTPGSGYSSTPTVTVAVPPQNLSFTTFWSNDGTSSAGSQPTAAVIATVTNGLFLAALGDSTLANMTVIPASLFTQPNLQLRIWFNDGINGFAVLSPLQNLTPAPYAAFANSASNLLGTVAASQLSGTVPNANLSGTYGGAVTFNNSADSFSGTFSGNGAGMTNLQLASLGTTGTLAQASGFYLVSTLPVGLSPQSVVAADINGDGKVDLISANESDSTLSVLTNNGSGIFGSHATLNVGSFPDFVAAADVNGDGKIDLISANTGPNTLTVLTNNGSGGFNLKATLNTGIAPTTIAVADLNGDGRMDLISANENGNSLSIYTNSASGNFGSNTTITVGVNPITVVAVDVTGDGKPDLIVGNYSDSTLSVFVNNGSGGFGAAINYAVGARPAAVVAGDFNGDGKLDIATANPNANSLAVFTNNGSGGFPTHVTIGGIPYATGLAAADLNNDGKADLVAADVNANTLTLLTNNGTGIFGINSTLRTGDYPQSVAAADIDGDGRMDLISANAINNTLSVFANLSRGLAVGGGGLVAENFVGNGGGLTGLNGSHITSGTVDDARLSSNVPLLNVTNVFTGANNFGNAPNALSGNGSGLTSLSAGNLTGTIPVGVLPGVVETNGGSLKIGNNGFIFTVVQAGQFVMPSSSTVETNAFIIFPQAFGNSPKIIVSVANDPGFPGVSDIFAASVSSNSPTAFRVNVIRLDSATGWSQQLRINWQAWQ